MHIPHNPLHTNHTLRLHLSASLLAFINLLSIVDYRIPCPCLSCNVVEFVSECVDSPTFFPTQPFLPRLFWVLKWFLEQWEADSEDLANNLLARKSTTLTSHRIRKSPPRSLSHLFIFLPIVVALLSLRHRSGLFCHSHRGTYDCGTLSRITSLTATD